MIKCEVHLSSRSVEVDAFAVRLDVPHAVIRPDFHSHWWSWSLGYDPKRGIPARIGSAALEMEPREDEKKPDDGEDEYGNTEDDVMRR
jgi:hypothetical protein